MMSIENIVLGLVLVLFILNFQTIVGGMIVYFFKLQEIVMKQITKEELEEDVKTILKPYEEFLLSKGFHFVSAIEHGSMIEKFDVNYHVCYYYNEELGVHVSLFTTPLKESILGASISFATFYESYRMALTFDGFVHNMVLPDNFYLFDGYYGSFSKALESHLEDRVIEGEVMVKEPLSDEGFKDYNEFMLEQNLSEMLNQNILKNTESGYRFKFSFSYWKHIHRTVKGYKRAKKVGVLNAKSSMPMAEPKSFQTLYKNSEEKTILRGLDEKPKPSTKEGKMRTFFISGLTFVLFFGLIGIPWSTLPLIVAVLLIHELGHFFAMKYFGYQDTSIFFIPLFGAAAKGEKEYVRSFEEYIVFLAGPVPGMVISVVIGVMMLNSQELMSNGLLREYALMSFVINYINLLPIYPLDGGKVVQTLLFTRYPKLQYYFFLTSLTVIIFSAIFFESPLMALFAGALFLSINHNANLAKLLGMLQREKLDGDMRQKAINVVTTHSAFEQLTLNKKAALAKQAIKLLNAEKPSKLLIFVGMAIYLLLIALPLAITVLFL